MKLFFRNSILRFWIEQGIALGILFFAWIKSGHHFCVLDVQYSQAQLPFIAAEILQKKHWLLFDSGSISPLSLNQNVLEKFSIDSEGEEFSINLFGEKFPTKYYCVPLMKLGGIRLKKIRTQMENPAFFSSTVLQRSRHDDLTLDPVRSGSLGIPIIKGIGTFLDFPSSRVGFCDPKLMPKIHFEKRIGVPIIPLAHGIGIEIATELGTFKMLIDTGSTYSVLHPSCIKEIKKSEENRRLKKHFFEAVHLGSFRIRKFSVLLLEYDLGSFDIDGVLGMDFLRKFQLIIDYQRQKIWMEPNS